MGQEAALNVGTKQHVVISGKNNITFGVDFTYGLCDLADGTKDKKWQAYSAAIASAYIFELIKCDLFTVR